MYAAAAAAAAAGVNITLLHIHTRQPRAGTDLPSVYYQGHYYLHSLAGDTFSATASGVAGQLAEGQMRSSWESRWCGRRLFKVSTCDNLDTKLLANSTTTTTTSGRLLPFCLPAVVSYLIPLLLPQLPVFLTNASQSITILMKKVHNKSQDLPCWWGRNITHMADLLVTVNPHNNWGCSTVRRRQTPIAWYSTIPSSRRGFLREARISCQHQSLLGDIRGNSVQVMLFRFVESKIFIYWR